MFEAILHEIRMCIENGCYMAALSLALTLPDICGKAEYPKDGNTCRYIKWYNEFIGQYEKPSDPYGSDMPYASGELIYNLRNAVLHQGTMSVDSGKIKEERCKVDTFELSISDVFNTGLSQVSLGKGFCIKERSLRINVIYLCNRLMKNANQYYQQNKEKFDFIQYSIIKENDDITCLLFDDNIGL